MEVGEGDVPVDDHDSGVSADVAEGLVVGSGDYVSAVATHQSQLCCGCGGGIGGGMSRYGCGGAIRRLIPRVCVS